MELLIIIINVYIVDFLVIDFIRNLLIDGIVY